MLWWLYPLTAAAFRCRICILIRVMAFLRCSPYISSLPHSSRTTHSSGEINNVLMCSCVLPAALYPHPTKLVRGMMNRVRKSALWKTKKDDDE